MEGGQADTATGAPADVRAREPSGAREARTHISKIQTISCNIRLDDSYDKPSAQ